MTERSERITYDEVESICSFLDNQDIEISTIKVHTILGKGSNTTISKYIEKWKTETISKLFKLSSKTIRFLEAEVENEAYKITNTVNMKLQEVEKERKILIDNNKQIQFKYDELKERYNKLEGNLNHEIEMHKQYKSAQQIEINHQKNELLDLQKENNKTAQENILLQTKLEMILEQNSELKNTLEKITTEKNSLLIELGMKKGFEKV
jgi:exonuclease VII large subunit